MKRILRGVLFSVPVLLVALLLTGVVLRAQTGSTAQITGTVRDSSGGVLPGADVTATQTETGFKRTVVTRSEEHTSEL